MIKVIGRNLILIAAFAVLGVPLLYYSYKHGTPEFGGLDVYSYYKLYSSWDFASVDSPFNQRLISSWCIYVVHLSGITYNTETEVARTGMDPQVYFSALLFNFMCVVMSAWMICKIVRDYVSKDRIFSFMGGMLFLLGFGTLIFLITALSDSLSVLMIAIILHSYIKRSWVQYVVLVLAIIQREYIFMMFGLIAMVHFVTEKQSRKYYGTVLLANILCFIGYLVLRKTLFFTPRYEHQMDVAGFIANISNSVQDIGAYLRQTFLLQNLLGIYLLTIFYKWFRRLSFNKTNLFIVAALLVQIVGLSVLIGLGNNTGRYFYMTTPLVIYYIAVEVHPLLVKPGNPTNNHDISLI